MEEEPHRRIGYTNASVTSKVVTGQYVFSNSSNRWWFCELQQAKRLGRAAHNLFLNFRHPVTPKAYIS